MKLLHFSDIHIGMENYSRLDPETGLSTRLLDFLKTFDFIVDLVISEKVDAVLFAGDAYKTRDPNPTQQRGFGERIKKIAKVGIPVVLVVGNHDTPNAVGKANTLDIYSALEIENVWISRKPEFLKIPTKSGALQVITLPWLHKDDYKTVAEQLRLLLEKVKPLEPAILLSHAEVEGSQYGSEKGMAIANDVTIPLPLLQDKRLSYVALGHIHKHQVLSQDPLVVYSGSPQRIDFGEEKEEKGVCLVKITPSVIPSERSSRGNLYSKKIATSPSAPRNDGFVASFKFIPTNCRKFLSIDIDLKPDDKQSLPSTVVERKNPTQTILDEIAKHEVEEKIVRVVINIPADLEAEIEMDKIKRALSNAFYIAGISRNVERKERLKIDGTDEVERLTPIEALQKYFEAKKYSKEKIKELEKHAAKIFES